MDCNKIKEKLIDYIDNKVNTEDEKEIKSHLENCQECKIEYEELKQTISYIEDGSKTIGQDRKLNLNSLIREKKYFESFTRTGIIAMALSLILVVTAFGSEIFGFMDWWKKASQDQVLAWEKLIDNGIGQKLDTSITDKNIEVRVKGVIADDLNTIILFEVKDLNGKVRFTPSFRDNTPFGPVTVGGDIDEEWEGIPPRVNFSNIYKEDGSIIDLIIKTDAMNREEGNISVNFHKFSSMINESEESIITVDGDWNFNIPVKKLKSKTYKIDKKIDLNGNELIINEIIVAPTTTSIKYKFDVYNEEKMKFLRDIYFSLKYKGNTYGRSELSSGSGMGVAIKNFGYQESEDHMESLYLEDPEEIQVIIDTAIYASRGDQEYDIDWDNLPQAIEYQGSILIVKAIENTDEGIEVTILEDNSKDREYISSQIHLEKGAQVELEFDGEIIKHNKNFSSFGSYSKLETHDENGKIEDTTGVFWTNKMYNFVLEQKLGLNDYVFKNYKTEEENHKNLFKPDKLVIKGQEYIKYPDIIENIQKK